MFWWGEGVVFWKHRNEKGRVMHPFKSLWFDLRPLNYFGSCLHVSVMTCIICNFVKSICFIQPLYYYLYCMKQIYAHAVKKIHRSCYISNQSPFSSNICMNLVICFLFMLPTLLRGSKIRLKIFPKHCMSINVFIAV